ncbi:hypothetical protein BC828DRAFT_374838 [Blastocladiella britannica]|nr:hypothetical protein BC828DRAFT_374838 [Blastocladiella britannica]
MSAIPPTLSPAEVEFLAENELVVIEPLQKLPVVSFLGNDIGPFVPPRPATVPLWAALLLKKRGLCKLKAPSWMTLESLQALVALERKEEGFSPMPFHYLEVAKLIFTAAKGDIPDAPAIQALIQDLREARRAKTRSGAALMTEPFLRLDNLAMMEVNEVRPTYARAFLTEKRIQRAAALAPPDSSTQSSAPTSSSAGPGMAGFQPMA